MYSCCTHVHGMVNWKRLFSSYTSYFFWIDEQRLKKIVFDRLKYQVMLCSSVNVRLQECNRKRGVNFCGHPFSAGVTVSRNEFQKFNSRWQFCRRKKADERCSVLTHDSLWPSCPKWHHYLHTLFPLMVKCSNSHECYLLRSLISKTRSTSSPALIGKASRVFWWPSTPHTCNRLLEHSISISPVLEWSINW